MKSIPNLFPIFTLFGSLVSQGSSLQQSDSSRRSFLTTTSATLVGGLTTAPTFAQAVEKSSSSSASLNFLTSQSGIQWADAKVGTGPIAIPGTFVSIDYVLSTTGARYGSQIYKTADKGAPYRWNLGDGTTISGLEEAILGGIGMDPMRPGGIRRVVIPPALAYQGLASLNQECGAKGTNGPVPPVPEAFEEFQRFKNIYCNPNRAYQPDVVMDIKLYGKRTSD